MKKNLIIPALTCLLIQGAIGVAQPANQSFNPADAAFVTNPFNYYGIQYAQVTPVYDVGVESLSLNYPFEFAITNPAGTDIAMIFNIGPDGLIRTGAADFRIKSLGQAFKLNSMEGDVGTYAGAFVTATITGFLGGNPVPGATGTINFSLATATSGGISYVNNGLGGNGGVLTFNALWQNLDEIRITGTDLTFGVDDLNFSPAVTGTMPVTLSAFNVIKKSATVELSWRTEMELNNSHFIVQRSTNHGDSFSNIGKVAGNGNATLPTDYIFIDQFPASGVHLYRLMQVDFDNTTTFSEIKVVDIDAAGTVKLFPNPIIAGQDFTIQTAISAPTPYSIVNINGRVIAKGVLSGNATRVTSQGMLKGNYILRVNGKQSVNFQIR